MDSLAASRRAAEHHALAVAAGPPRSARWSLPSAVVCALGAAVALPLLRPAGLALAALAVLLLAVHRQDRRNAWRYVPEPVTPARLLPPLRPEVQEVVTRTPVPAAPTSKPAVKAVHVRTAAVPVLALPRPRTPVETGAATPRKGRSAPRSSPPALTEPRSRRSSRRVAGEAVSAWLEPPIALATDAARATCAGRAGCLTPAAVRQAAPGRGIVGTTDG
jgi:hypothetical protein